MLTEKLIKKVYSVLINYILKNIPDQDKKEVSENYLAYLYQMYSNKEIDENNFEDALLKIIHVEQLALKDCDANQILRRFKKDDSYNIIKEISNYGFELASLKLKDASSNVISNIEAKKNIGILMKEADNVLEFNQNESRRLVSEGILDFYYASGMNNEITSFRLHNVENSINKKTSLN